MNELEEIKLRNLFFNTIMEFFWEHIPPNLIAEEAYQAIAHDLTNNLIEDYEDSKQLDTN